MSESSESSEVIRARQYYHQGLQFAQRGAWSEALEALSRAVKTAPDHVDARLQLGDVYLKRGCPEDGLRVIEQGLARLGGDKTQRTQLLGKAASCAASMSRYDVSHTYLQEALELAPMNPGLLDKAAAVCCKGGEFSTGFDYFLKASAKRESK